MYAIKRKSLQEITIKWSEKKKVCSYRRRKEIMENPIYQIEKQLMNSDQCTNNLCSILTQCNQNHEQVQIDNFSLNELDQEFNQYFMDQKQQIKQLLKGKKLLYDQRKAQTAKISQVPSPKQLFKRFNTVFNDYQFKLDLNIRQRQSLSRQTEIFIKNNELFGKSLQQQNIELEKIILQLKIQFNQSSVLLKQQHQSIQQSIKSKNLNALQLSVKKLQEHDALFSYVYQFTVQNVESQIMYNPVYEINETKRPFTINFFGLKLFVLTSFYPMVRSIFKYFPSQSNIYSLLINHDIGLSSQQVENYFKLLRKRIEKSLILEKHKNLQDYFQRNAEIRKITLIFICSQIRMQSLLDTLRNDLRVFCNNFITFNELSLSDMTKNYKQTNFGHQKLVVFYLYEKIATKKTVDILWITPEQVTLSQINKIRQNSLKFEPVLMWSQISQCVITQKMNDFVRVNNAMKICTCFGSASIEQKEIPEKIKRG